MKIVHIIDRPVLSKLDLSAFSEGDYIIRYNTSISTDPLKLFHCHSEGLKELGMLNHYSLELAIKTLSIRELRSLFGVQSIQYNELGFSSLELRDNELESLLDKCITPRSASRGSSTLTVNTDYTDRTTPEIVSPSPWSPFPASQAFFRDYTKTPVPVPDPVPMVSNQPDSKNDDLSEEIGDLSFDLVFDPRCNGSR